jgi:hypothetical protein
MQRPLSARAKFKDINNYLIDDFIRYRENSQKDLDELVDQGVFSETEIDQMKHHGEFND